jgi:hypothetical protein
MPAATAHVIKTAIERFIVFNPNSLPGCPVQPLLGTGVPATRKVNTSPAILTARTGDRKVACPFVPRSISLWLICAMNCVDFKDQVEFQIIKI